MVFIFWFDDRVLDHRVLDHYTQTIYTTVENNSFDRIFGFIQIFFGFIQNFIGSTFWSFAIIFGTVVALRMNYNVLFGCTRVWNSFVSLQ